MAFQTIEEARKWLEKKQVQVWLDGEARRNVLRASAKYHKLNLLLIGASLSPCGGEREISDSSGGETVARNCKNFLLTAPQFSFSRRACSSSKISTRRSSSTASPRIPTDNTTRCRPTGIATAESSTSSAATTASNVRHRGRRARRAAKVPMRSATF